MSATPAHPELGFYTLAGAPKSPRDMLGELAHAEELGLGTAFISERFNIKEIATISTGTRLMHKLLQQYMRDVLPVGLADRDNISEADIVHLNIPNGIPLVYELDAELKPIKSYYLGDAEAAARAAAAVAAAAGGDFTYGTTTTSTGYGGGTTNVHNNNNVGYQASNAELMLINALFKHVSNWVSSI